MNNQPEAPTQTELEIEAVFDFLSAHIPDKSVFKAIAGYSFFSLKSPDERVREELENFKNEYKALLPDARYLSIIASNSTLEVALNKLELEFENKRKFKNHLIKKYVNTTTLFYLACLVFIVYAKLVNNQLLAFIGLVSSLFSILISGIGIAFILKRLNNKTAILSYYIQLLRQAQILR